MVRHQGNALTGATPQGHRPLPLAAADGQVYRRPHTVREQPKGFDWGWNKADCTSCSTPTTKTARRA